MQLSSLATTLWPRVRHLLIPAVALIVALCQLIMVHQHRLTRWRGAGFGMYSELHPSHRQLWLAIEGHPARSRWLRPLDLSPGGCDAPQARLTRCEKLPTRDCLCELAACLGLSEPHAVRAYQPLFDPDAPALSWELLGACEVGMRDAQRAP